VRLGEAGIVGGDGGVGLHGVKIVGLGNLRINW
jgi:hypothetical protein